MYPPIEKGTRIVVNGNLQPYAKAIVVDCILNKDEDRWCIVLEWPDAPGGGTSRVWSTDEGRSWVRYSDACAALPN